jgi:hypothetical protein
MSIKNNENDKCPYGLDIPFACKCAGDSVSRMAPLSISKDDESDIIKSNKRLLILQGTGERCKYANNIFDEKKSVECGYDSDSPGVHPAKLEAAPFYSKVYNNIALDGLYSYPLGYYADYNISRNLYYGTYSIQSSEKHEIKKEASIDSDIKDAVEHAVMLEDSSFTGNVYFDIGEVQDLPISEILRWDDYSSWGDFDWNEFDGISDDERIKILNSFRPGYGDLVKSWDEIPPIILVKMLNGDKCIGDGRGRVNYAMAAGKHNLKAIVITEKENDGDISFKFVYGRIDD